MKMVDTSCWVEALRRHGNASVRTRLEELVKSGEASWCAPIRLELWAGVGSDKERRVLREFERVIRDYPITDEVWRAACDLAERGRSSGKTFPVIDLLVFACARHYRLEFEHADRHFNELAKLCA